MNSVHGRNTSTYLGPSASPWHQLQQRKSPNIARCASEWSRPHPSSNSLTGKLSSSLCFRRLLGLWRELGTDGSGNAASSLVVMPMNVTVATDQDATSTDARLHVCLLPAETNLYQSSRQWDVGRLPATAKRMLARGAFLPSAALRRLTSVPSQHTTDDATTHATLIKSGANRRRADVNNNSTVNEHVGPVSVSQSSPPVSVANINAMCRSRSVLRHRCGLLLM